MNEGVASIIDPSGSRPPRGSQPGQGKHAMPSIACQDQEGAHCSLTYKGFRLRRQVHVLFDPPDGTAQHVRMGGGRRLSVLHHELEARPSSRPASGGDPGLRGHLESTQENAGMKSCANIRMRGDVNERSLRAPFTGSGDTGKLTQPVSPRDRIHRQRIDQIRRGDLDAARRNAR
jgi:hypothetical protein